MKTNIVYALTSDENDYFLEQLQISVHTLKQNNPDVKVVLVIDDVTNEHLKGNRKKALDEIDNIEVVRPIDCTTKKERSRWIKTNLRNLITADYLFIDTDTLIISQLQDIDFCEDDVMAVLDRHLPLDRNQKGEAAKKQFRKANLNFSDKDNIYFNSGVMYVKDTDKSRKLYDEWHKIWRKSKELGIDVDQPALSSANARMGYIISELSGDWNCQILGNGLKYLSDAKIIHYFNSNLRTKVKSNPYLFAGDMVFKELRDNGYNIDSVRNYLSAPYNLFSDRYELISDDLVDFYYSEASQLLLYLYGYHHRVYTFINGLCRFVFGWK